MLVKHSVKIDGFKPQMMFACGMVELAYRHIAGVTAVLTSALDSHDDRPASLHLKGLAADFRTRTITLEQARAIETLLKVMLGPLGYDVQLEDDHLHVEYDPKPGENLFTRTA